MIKLFKKNNKYISYLTALALGQANIFLLFYLFSENSVSLSNITYSYSFVVLGISVCLYGINYKIIYYASNYGKTYFFKKILYFTFYLNFLSSLIYILILILFIDFFENQISFLELFLCLFFATFLVGMNSVFSIVSIAKYDSFYYLFLNLMKLSSLFFAYYFLSSISMEYPIKFYLIIIFSNLVAICFNIFREKVYNVSFFNITFIKYYYKNILKVSFFNYINGLISPILISYININLNSSITKLSYVGIYNLSRYFSVLNSFLPNSYSQKVMPEYMKIPVHENNQIVKKNLLNKYLNNFLIMTILFWLLLIAIRPLIFNIYSFESEGAFIYNFVISIAAMTIITSIPGFHLNSIFKYRILFFINFLVLVSVFTIFEFFDLSLSNKFFCYLVFTFIFNYFLIIMYYKFFGKRILLKTLLFSVMIILFNYFFR
tara:strand:+ start:36819 stop:38117 length:1299 start_codon:yes stop_codon:yes gene_type:complete